MIKDDPFRTIKEQYIPYESVFRIVNWLLMGGWLPKNSPFVSFSMSQKRSKWIIRSRFYIHSTEYGTSPIDQIRKDLTNIDGIFVES